MDKQSITRKNIKSVLVNNSMQTILSDSRDMKKEIVFEHIL